MSVIEQHTAYLNQIAPDFSGSQGFAAYANPFAVADYRAPQPQVSRDELNAADVASSVQDNWQSFAGIADSLGSVIDRMAEMAGGEATTAGGSAGAAPASPKVQMTTSLSANASSAARTQASRQMLTVANKVGAGGEFVQGWNDLFDSGMAIEVVW